jgi:hypothetical protein
LAVQLDEMVLDNAEGLEGYERGELDEMSDNEHLWDDVRIAERVSALKSQLANINRTCTAADYVKFRAIYEYLIRLKAGGKDKMRASKDAANLVYMEDGPACKKFKSHRRVPQDKLEQFLSTIK